MAHSSSHYYCGGGGGGYDSTPTRSSLSFYDDYGSTVSTSIVPKFLQPNPASTHLAVEFKEYDPTPYGGGYDLGATYGKPLPPSDQTCCRQEGPAHGTTVGREHKEDEQDNPWGWDGSAFRYCPCACHAHSHGGYRRGQSQPSWFANYIFGCSAYPYGQGREFGGNYPNPIFGYERHHQGQSLLCRVQYEEPSLLNVSTNFF